MEEKLLLMAPPLPTTTTTTTRALRAEGITDADAKSYTSTPHACNQVMPKFLD